MNSRLHEIIGSYENPMVHNILGDKPSYTFNVSDVKNPEQETQITPEHDLLKPKDPNNVTEN